MEIKKTMKEKFFHNFVITTFVALYLIVSLISTIHVIAFFELSNPYWLAVSLAIAFEIGAAASLSSIIVLDKVDKKLVWFLFILLTAMQAMGNTFYAFTHLEDYMNWVNLFGLNEMAALEQKRILSIVSGAILPIVALGFIKSLVDYMKPPGDGTIIDEIPVKTEEHPEEHPVDLVFEKVEEIEKSDVEKVIENPIIEKDLASEFKIPMSEDSNDDENVKLFKDQFNRETLIPESKGEVKESIEDIVKEIEEEIKTESIEIKPEAKKKAPEKKIKAKPVQNTDFEKELDALKQELEKEKGKTKFEKELEHIRGEVKSEKEKNQALKVKREEDELAKKTEQDNDIKTEAKKTKKIKENISKGLGKTKKVKELIVKPMVKRNPNPTRPL